MSSDAVPTTGWGTTTAAVCRALLARGDIRLRLLLPKAATRVSDPDLARVVEYVLPPALRSFRRAPWAARHYLFHAPRLEGVQLVHALVEFPYAIAASSAARRVDVPFVVSTHGTYAVVPLQRQPNRYLYRRALRRAATLTAPSVYTRDALISALREPAHVDVIANGVDSLRFAERPIRARRGRSSISLSVPPLF